ncbi:MAG: hypothetical protein JWP50_521 [Phenylobacterium sp.]|nr:hypothetical protein [Phenylobacterium sp.]
MSTEPPEEHLKSLWQDQYTETPTMSVETLRARADAFHRKTRLRNIIGFAICLGSAVFLAFAASQAPTEVIRAADLIMVAGAVWMGWWIGRLWPSEPPESQASGVQLLDFQRAALRRQLTSFSRLMFLGAPMLIGLGVGIAGLALKARHGQLTPILVFVGVWLAATWWLNRRHQSKLQRQIEELDALRRG